MRTTHMPRLLTPLQRAQSSHLQPSLIFPGAQDHLSCLSLLCSSTVCCCASCSCITSLKSDFSMYSSVAFAGKFAFCCGAVLKQSIVVQVFGILRAVVRYVPYSLHTSSNRWIETKTTGFMQLSSTMWVLYNCLRLSGNYLQAKNLSLKQLANHFK